ncbi:UNVERIFIED_CONTAM: hypothetical protein H355_010600, partial [Colinus virginianus]
KERKKNLFLSFCLLAASLWGPYKDILQTVMNAICKRQPEAIHRLDQVLKKHRSDFISLFRNPPKNVQQHEKIQKASTEGVAIQGQQGTRLLPEQLIREAFILSDLFDIGELAAVELLLAALAEFTEADEATAELAVADNVFLFLTESVVGSENFYQEEFYIRKIHNLVTDFLALMPMKKYSDIKLLPECVSSSFLGYSVHFHSIGEHQQPHFPGLTRGLVAVLLYWDGKRCIANSLRTLIQSRQGKTWTLELSQELVSMTTRFTDDLMEQGLTQKILTLVSQIDLNNEFDKLQRERGLGSEKHRKEVSDLIKECRQSLAESLFVWTCQSPLSKDDTLILISYLEKVTVEADGSLDAVNLSLLMALLYCFDVSFLEQGTEDREDLMHRLPLLAERQYIAAIHTRLQESQPWKLPGLQATVRLAWALALRGISQFSDVTVKLAVKSSQHYLSFKIAELYRKDPFNLELALEYWCPSEPLQTSTIMGSYLGVAHQRPPQRQVIYISENIQGAGGSPVSWEHFFHSLMLYHEHLRKDLPSADSVQYRHLPLRGITQKEQDGLIAFLQLTTVIVNWSENARLALCEHPQWTPVVVILGLLQCSIPPVLKAELLETLTAFGKSPEIAASLWQSLEYTQILQTVRAPGQRQAIGIEVELNEIESRCEEYPLTRAFCRLISTLVESSFPSNLGAGLRPPGFDPYLQFLRDSVFLRFRTRAYRRAAEKWEVAEVVLEVFYKLLRDYEPQLEDFVDQYVELQGDEIIVYKPPGFNLMYHLLNESPMLELSLSLLEEGVKQLDTYAPFPGKKHLEKAVQYCLALLNLTLQKENLFMDLLRESHLSLIVTPLEQLLQGINPRTKKADHVVNIARYLYHGNSNPELAFESAKILCCISCNSNIQIKLVGDFTHDQSTSQKLMAGFVECLDNEDAEELINPGDVNSELEPEKKRARIHHETRIHILNLLITSLECSPPSLALYLLGYELKKPVSTTNLQDPEHEISTLNQMSWLMKTAAIEMRVTSLNRQRSHTQRLLHLLLDDMPVKPYLADGEGGMEDESRSVSGFLHFDTASKVRRKILSILDSIDFSQDIPEPLQLDFFDRVQIEQVIANCEHKNARGQVVCNVKHLHRVLVAEVNALQGMAAIGQRPLLMEEINTILQYVVERNKLLQCLHAKKHALESWRQLVEIILTACPQDLIQAEDRQLIIRDLLQDIHDKAKQNFSAFSILFSFLIVTLMKLEPFIDKFRRHFSVNWNDDSLEKILDDDAAQELMPVVAGAVFTLTAHLSQSVKTEQKQPLSVPVTGQSQYALMLDGSFTSSPGSDSISVGFASIGDSSLHIILKKLLDFILKTGGGFQRVRTHLYGSLLYYLQIAQRPDEPDTLEAAKKTMWERLTAPEDVFSKLQRENMAIIESYGAALMEVVCRDACDGHEIGRMLALALLDRIVSVDKQQQWLLYLSNSGYLKVLVDSLADDDLTLQSLLTPQPPLLKALYTYESKMAFLTRVAKSQQGALELLRSGVIVRLAQCQVYDMRPETDHQGMYGMRDSPVFIPAPVERYHQILLPALQLCQVILTSSMAQHLQAAGQVLQFLISHSDTIQAILRCQDVSVGSLQELAFLTGIISKAALPGVLNELDVDVNEGTQMELQGHIGRFQRQCLGLLSRFGGSDRLRQFKLQDDNAEGDRVNRRDEIELAMQQICANVMEYCESLMLQSAPSFEHTVCLFTPSLSESTNRDGPRQDTQVPVVPYWRLPGLGIIIYLLKQSTNDFFSYYDSHRQSVNKLQNVEQLPPDEIKELCQSVMPAGVDKISTAQKYVLARRRLVKLINNRAKLLSLCSCILLKLIQTYTPSLRNVSTDIIETCLFVLWRHLEHYLLNYVPTDSQDSLLSSRTSFKRGRLQDSFGSESSLDFSSGLNRVSQHDIDQLQIETTNSFGESLQKKLLDIEGLYSKVRSRYTFIQALVRRIRGLLRISRT